MYDIGLPSKSSLFDLQAGRIRKLARLAEKNYGKEEGSVRIRWYVMTSGPTRPETEKFFKEKGYFGLDEKDVIFFEQGKLQVHPRSEVLSLTCRRPTRSIKRRQAPPRLSLIPISCT
jgi:UDP-N-acetylglucosamine pyrophosphorylase